MQSLVLIRRRSSNFPRSYGDVRAIFSIVPNPWSVSPIRLGRIIESLVPSTNHRQLYWYLGKTCCCWCHVSIAYFLWFNIVFFFNFTLTGIEYPFYGTQWHPEQNCFEWIKTKDIAHSRNAVVAAQYFANFFVNEARKSNHRFASTAVEDKYLIYNFNPLFTGNMGHFEQSYVFK